MKNYIYILSLLFFGLFSCSTIQPDTTQEDSNIPNPWIDNTHILGKLNYVVNPFNEMDSVLCLSDIQEIVIKTADYDYYTYLMEILGKYGKVDDSDSWPQQYHVTCYPKSDVICYIMQKESFISIMTPDFTDKVNYIQYSATINVGYSKYKTITCTIYPYFNNCGNDEFSREFYLGDYVTYTWKDYSRERFIYVIDTMNLSEGLSEGLCFEGLYGPVYTYTYHSDKSK